MQLQGDSEEPLQKRVMQFLRDADPFRRHLTVFQTDGFPPSPFLGDLAALLIKPGLESCREPRGVHADRRILGMATGACFAKYPATMRPYVSITKII